MGDLPLQEALVLTAVLERAELTLTREEVAMPVSPQDRKILRDLAAEVAEVAAQPIMSERREMWKRHNSLARIRPMILVFPEGAWRELLPQTALQCVDDEARQMEWQLRSRLYHHEHFFDDTVIEAEWVVDKVVHNSGWGLQARQVDSSTPTGAWAFDPVIHSPADLEKLRFPKVEYDDESTREKLAAAQDLFADILEVKLKGIACISFHLMNIYTKWRGLEQVLLDMCDNPAMLHNAMAFLEEGHHRLVAQYQDLDLLSPNNDATYHSSGGVGYTEELPPVPRKSVRPIDMWASAEAQEMDPVSPAMHEEFVLQYERRLLAPFGLNGYGCCDDLTRKFDYVLQIPRLRRISIAPWANVDAAAERLGSDYIFSWKPQPTFLVGDFDEDRVRAYIKHTIDASADCVLEMILKDTHTCENHPERFTRWTAIARELVEN